MTFDSVGVIGGGAWGTALAQTLRLAGARCVLWAREPEVVGRDQRRHANTAFLPGVRSTPACGHRPSSPTSPRRMWC